uniref:Uncharacterized protein n=1 Tax=viral metagenome TaxID=1070528 RepID=A0A6M3KPZ8_9ZZZZ
MASNGMKTHRFNGKQYRIILADDLDGFCETSEAVGYCWLTVNRSLSKRIGLETVIHEALHACDPSASEKKVKTIAADIARFLWRLGYRKRKEE